MFRLEALALIELKRGNSDIALQHVAKLALLDPSDSVGWPVISLLAEGVV